MSDHVYEQLAEALDKLPNGFPRTPSNVEIRILKKIFELEEASIASQLGRSAEATDALAERVGLSVKDAEEKLMNMARRGLLWYEEANGKS